MLNSGCSFATRENTGQINVASQILTVRLLNGQAEIVQRAIQAKRRLFPCCGNRDFVKEPDVV